MRIQLSKNLPSIHDLTEILRQRFSDQYSVKTFGLGKQSILVGKSTLVGAEISIRENEVSLSSSPPSVFGSILLTLGLTELAVVLIPFLLKDGVSQQASYRKLEKEIGTFLVQAYQ